MMPDPIITCAEFRDRYCEYLDGLMMEADAAAWRGHATSCLPCARYDRTIRRSRRLVGLLPRVEASSDFYLRLERRLSALDRVERAHPFGSTLAVATSLAVVGILAAAVARPMLTDSPPTIELPAVEARAPVRASFAPQVGSLGARSWQRPSGVAPVVWNPSGGAGVTRLYGAGGELPSVFREGPHFRVHSSPLLSSTPITITRPK